MRFKKSVPRVNQMEQAIMSGMMKNRPKVICHWRLWSIFCMPKQIKLIIKTPNYTHNLAWELSTVARLLELHVNHELISFDDIGSDLRWDNPGLDDRHNSELHPNIGVCEYTRHQYLVYICHRIGGCPPQFRILAARIREKSLNDKVMVAVHKAYVLMINMTMRRP